MPNQVPNKQNPGNENPAKKQQNNQGQNKGAEKKLVKPDKGQTDQAHPSKDLDRSKNKEKH